MMTRFATSYTRQKWKRTYLQAYTQYVQIRSIKYATPAAAASSHPTLQPSTTANPPSSFISAFPPFHSPSCSFIHGDACSPDSYATLFGGGNSMKKVNLILTDPPYCLLRPKGKPEATTHTPTTRKKLLWDPTGAASTLRFDSTSDYRAFTVNWLKPILPYCAPDSVFIIWTNYLGKQPIIDGMKDVYRHMKLWHEYLWIKPNKPDPKLSQQKKMRIQHSITKATTSTSESTSNTSRSPSSSPPSIHSSLPPLHLSLTSSEIEFRCYEVALIFGVGSFQTSRWYSSNPNNAVVCPYEEVDPSTITSSSSSSSLLTHPNAKPRRVIQPLIEQYSAPHSLILDPFAGSSSIGVTALQLDRSIASMELNDLWARHMRQQLMNQLASTSTTSTRS